MKTKLLLFLSCVGILATEMVEPPRIIGARFHRTNEGQGTKWVTLYILHPHEDGFQIQQVSDGRTNKIEVVQHSKKGTIAFFNVKLNGLTNVFTSRCFDSRTGDIISEWGTKIEVIPDP